MPSAMLRSRPSAKVVISRESPAGASSAPPRPWSPRKATSEPADQESPHRTELTAKSAIPAAKTLRRPSTSASLPPSRRNPPKTIAYAVTTHSSPDWVKPRSVSIDGSATFTIATSRITMNCATTMSASAAHGLVGSSRRRIAETDIYYSSQSLINTTIAHIYSGTGYTSDMATTTESPLAKAGVKPPRELVSSPSFLLKRLGFAVKDRVTRRVRGRRRERLPLRRPRRARGGRPRDAGDDRRRARLRPQLPRRASRRARGARADRAPPRSGRPPPPHRARHAGREEGAGAATRRPREVDDEFFAPLSADERKTLHALLLRLAAHHDPRYATNGH